jgi:outer membrane protein
MFGDKSWSGCSMKVIFVLVAMVLAVTAVDAVAQELKIGYVNPFRIQNESVTARQALENLQKEFASREQEVADLGKRVANLKDDLDKNAATMQPDERQNKEKTFNTMATELQQMQQDLAEDVDLRKREEYERVVVEANAVIKQIAEAGKYDLIVQDAVFSSQQTDITDQVLSEMAKRPEEKGNAGK